LTVLWLGLQAFRATSRRQDRLQASLSLSPSQVRGQKPFWLPSADWRALFLRYGKGPIAAKEENGKSVLPVKHSQGVLNAMKNVFDALPAYLGGKRRLAPLIFALLDRHVPRSGWQGKTFVDPFLGGGSVSLLAKAYGFRVICNDLALRSAVIGRAFIANGCVALERSDVALLLREPDIPYPRVAEERYAPSVFSCEHARLIDRALWWARSDYFPEPKRSLALVLLIKWALRVQPMSMLRGTDARAAFSGDYDRVSPRRVGHYVRSLDLLRPAAW